MDRSDGEVVLEGKSVELSKQGSELFAARGLSVDDMHVALVVDVEDY